MNAETTPRLGTLPVAFPATVAALHRVAEQVIAPACKPDNEIALTPTPGGFGTPVFRYGSVDHQVRVHGAELVHRTGDDEQRAPLTTLEDARQLVVELVPAGPLGDTPLDLDPNAAARLADWYAFGASLLEELVASAATEDDATSPTLWPEHFDIAIELGDEAAGARANYGFSPGDEQHAEPYVYVGPWTAPPAGPLWNASGFPGAELTYTELQAAPDQCTAALEFFTTRKEALA
jgi:hypothetical protein